MWIDCRYKLPKENEWVIGLCKLQSEILLSFKPVVFQVKWDKNRGWSDWCGDCECNTDWIVTHWMSIPDYPIGVIA